MDYKKLSLLVLIILVLNLIWEFSHYRLYFDLTGIPSNLHLVLASFVDVILIFIIILLIASIKKKLSWINNPSKRDYVFFIIANLVLAFIWELININLERWAYKEIMPTIFGVGLSPILQLPITAGLSLFLFNWLSKKF